MRDYAWSQRPRPRAVPCRSNTSALVHIYTQEDTNVYQVMDTACERGLCVRACAGEHPPSAQVACDQS